MENDLTPEQLQRLEDVRSSTYRPDPGRLALAARKLSAAFGRNVPADDVNWVSEDGRMVVLADDSAVALRPGNTARTGGVTWVNGKTVVLD